MRNLIAALLLALPLSGQLVLPPGSEAVEGSASDGGVWTWQTFRASCRYPATWITAPRKITGIAWRADSTYAASYDRLPGLIIVRIGAWMGDATVAWSSIAPVFVGNIDPPQMSINKPNQPQPFFFTVPLWAPVVIVQGGLEIDVTFSGPWDPVFGNRAAYWVDAQQNQGGASLSDQWIDQVPPYMGCAGWISETRADRFPGKITMEARYTMHANAPAILAIGALPQILGCAHVAATVFLPTTTDPSSWIQYNFNQPQADLTWAWQAWVYDPLRPPEQCLGSGHYCRWAINDRWPCQTIYAYDASATAPTGSIDGSAWVVEVR